MRLQQLEKRLWDNPSPTWVVRSLRVLLAVIRVVRQSKLPLYATSLTYYSLLATVPLLAILFTLLKSFGLSAFLYRLLSELFEPMGQSGQDVGHYLLQFVHNAQAGMLGGIGVLFFLYTVFSLFHKIERALNDIWQIRSLRPFTSRLLGYIGMIVLVLVTASLALGLNVVSHFDTISKYWSQLPVLPTLSVYLVKLLSILVTALLLALLYAIIPNTRVRFSAAYIGGLFCSVLWIPLTAGFAYMLSFSSGYSIIYGSFAGVVITLIWINILWLLFLAGGLVSYFAQCPTWIAPQYRA